LVIGVAALVPVAVVVGAVISTELSGSADASPISAARPFTLPPVNDGAPGAALTAVPGRPTLVAFFAAWCDPCRAELPLIQAASARDSGRIAFVGVDDMDNQGDAAILLSNAGVTFPTGFDNDGAVSAKWRVSGLPVNVLVAADGRVLDYHRGQLDQAQLDQMLQKAA
jgi:thiol-disulfide isomerase/thioredoxin